VEEALPKFNSLTFVVVVFLAAADAAVVVVVVVAIVKSNKVCQYLFVM